MRIRLLNILALTFLPGDTMAQECRPATTALVLSGGGAKGLAHIATLSVLDSLGIRPDLIVGTSMGAIVGAMYASGYSARQIDSLARALPISAIVRPFRTTAPHAWDQRVPILFLVRGRRGFEFQTGVVDENEPNARLNSALLRGNLLARGRFERLPIPFRAVATDLRDRSTVVLVDGDLARAVRASSAIPLVLPPVLVGDAVLVDGGLSANVPIAQARAAGAERVIVSDVTERPKDSLDVESPLALADQLLGFLFHQPPATLSADDIYVRPDVQSFRSLDFSKETVEDLLARGRRAADTTISRARCLLPRPPVEVPPLPGTLARWSLTTGSAADSTLIARMLRLTPQSPIDVAQLRARLIGLGQAEALRGVWLNPTGNADTVSFRIEVIRAPRTVGGGGISYDHELGGQAWAGVFDRRVFGTTLEATILLSVGKLRRELYGAALWHFDAGWSHLTPMTSFRVGTEDVRRFARNGDQLSSLPTSDARLNSGLEIWTGNAWRVRLGVDLATWEADTATRQTTAGASTRVLRTGPSGPQITGDLTLTGAFRWATFAAAWPISRRAWSVLPTVRLGWGEDLPIQWTFPLGGDEGFPGLHLGERRGFRESSGSLRLGYRVKRPIEVRLLLAAGRTWTPGAGSEEWLGGARLGLGTDTPAGPIDVGYGFATSGRRALFIRLGKRF